MTKPVSSDCGEASPGFDEIKAFLGEKDILLANEAQTRFDVIDRLVKNVLGWRHNQIDVEERCDENGEGYVDYLLRAGDVTIVIEAKRAGAAFPNPTRNKRLKLSGAVLGHGQIAAAITQAHRYCGEKNADVAIVTNGLCWCAHPFPLPDEDSYATMFFPFSFPGDAEEFFNYFAEPRVEQGSLHTLTLHAPRTEDRLLSLIVDSDGRVDRNNIADHILPALDNALYADALLNNPDSLEKCFVATEARVKFDSYLGMHLADPKPTIIRPAKRIRKDKEHDHLEEIVEQSVTSHAPPVTLVIGPVGAGKSTYLKHFETISARSLLEDKGTHWVNIDFEKMGREGSPRKLIYQELRSYLGAEHPGKATDYKTVVGPAYAEEVAALARGPLAPIFTQKEIFHQKVAEHIAADFAAVEPYVDKVFKHIAQNALVIIVLDNIDLYEDEELERSVFAEGLALSKRILCNVFVSVRDTTYVKHSTDATFDAYELRKLWLDAPPFKAVLSARLTYSRKILQGKYARIGMFGGMTLEVQDLGNFFDVVQRSMLKGQAGDFIEKISDSNIRKGLKLVTNFLTSGHIQADRALSQFLKGDTTYTFPFHEIFKGTMLSQWKHYQEGRAECINVFDAHLGAKQLRLLRLHLLAFLYARAQREESLEVPVAHAVETLSKMGASEAQIVSCIALLLRHGLIRTITAEAVNAASTVVLSRCGGYYIHTLAGTFAYAEACLVDTAIEDASSWDQLAELTRMVEGSRDFVKRMELRYHRMEVFLDYLQRLEQTVVGAGAGNVVEEVKALPRLAELIRQDSLRALRGSQRRAERSQRD